MIHWSRAFYLISRVANVSSDVDVLRASRPTEPQLIAVLHNLESAKARGELREDPQEVIESVRDYFEKADSVWNQKKF